MMASDANTASSSKLDSTYSCLTQNIFPASGKASGKKPIVVGIYGIPGSGKTTLLRQLKEELGDENFTFYDGSTVIDRVVPGGLAAFKKFEDDEKMHWRGIAIKTIRDECTSSQTVGVVAGHFMFWEDARDEEGETVCTPMDLEVYTHIIYLDVSAEVIEEYRSYDRERGRAATSVRHLGKWQYAEKSQLRDLCRQYEILFMLISPNPGLMLPKRAATLLRDFQCHDEPYNFSQAIIMLDYAITSRRGELETVLVMDADKTLTEQDTGRLFWDRITNSRLYFDNEYPLKKLFSSPMGYTYTAFRQAVLMYEETADDQEFETTCQQVALTVDLHPEILSLLQLVTQEKHIGVVIMTCGLRRVWEIVFEREGLSETVNVIGGGRIADGFVVTAEVKGALVAQLRYEHGLYTWAFGDSPLDLGMLHEADEAIVVVGEEETRSNTMDAALWNAVVAKNLKARQVLLPGYVTPRLEAKMLPLLQLTDDEFIQSVLCHGNGHAAMKLLHATDKGAATLLMTPMRDATISGPILREAHRRVGWYLATEFLSGMVGVEKYSIPHVQGYPTDGYRLLKENRTLIVALMRGGEPMAMGVNDAFPLAMFLHADSPEDILPQHLHGKTTVVLVDSVVNSGKTVVDFMQHVHNFDFNVQIVVLAGVVQEASIRERLSKALPRRAKLGLVALRLSQNKFTGKGTTDTGNRLFNSTYLP